MPNDDVRDALKQPNGETLVRQAVENAKPWSPNKTSGKVIELTTMRKATEDRLAEHRQGPQPRIGTGIPKLDETLGGGFDYGTMAVTAALSSHGKTAFALQTCHYIITELKIPVVFVSIEMTVAQLADRTFSHISSAPKPNWHQLTERLEDDSNRHFRGAAEFHLIDRIMTLEEVEEAIRAAFEKGAKIAFVDYAGKVVTGHREDQNASMKKVSAKLTDLAKEYNSVIVCLAQLNKRVANRENMIPQMHDVQYGTDLVNDAGYVLFNVWPHKIDKSNPFDDYIVMVAKNRNGDSDVAVKCKFNAPRQRISEAASQLSLEEQERMSEFDVFNEGNQ